MVEEMMRDFTALGSTGVFGLMVLAVGGFLVMMRKARRRWPWFMSFVLIDLFFPLPSPAEFCSARP
jgi:hypothetical protein